LRSGSSPSVRASTSASRSSLPRSLGDATSAATTRLQELVFSSRLRSLVAVRRSRLLLRLAHLCFCSSLLCQQCPHLRLALVRGSQQQSQSYPYRPEPVGPCSKLCSAAGTVPGHSPAPSSAHCPKGAQPFPLDPSEWYYGKKAAVAVRPE
jgi:hypothetical protein